MRVTMVAPFGFRPKGTTRWRVLPLARAAARPGCRVTVVVPSWDWPADAGRRWEDGGVDVVCVAAPRLGGAAGAPGWLSGVIREANRSAPDVVHVFKPIGYSGACGAWMRRGGVPVCVDADDWEGRGGWSEAQGRPRWQRAVIAAQERRGLLGADHLTVASHALAERTAQLGVPSERITLLANISSLPQATSLGPRAGAVLYTRFVEVSPAWLVELWRRIAAQVPDATLTVIGEGLHGEERELAQRVREAGLASLRVQGAVAPDDLPVELSRFAAALFPCDDTEINRKKCSVRLADLVAQGLPVVAHAVGECAHYVQDGVSGLLATPGDDDGFVRAAVALLRDSSLARRMGDAASVRYRECYSPDRAGAKLVGVYEGLLKGRQTAHR